MGTIRIPMIIGNNRLHGTSVGAMVVDHNGESLSQLRRALRESAVEAEVDPTDDWLGKAVLQMLHLYSEAAKQFREKRDDEIGFVFEGVLPNGEVLLMGSPYMLARV